MPYGRSQRAVRQNRCAVSRSLSRSPSRALSPRTDVRLSTPLHPDHRQSFTARRRFLLPSDTWDFPRAETWPADWVSGLEVRSDAQVARGAMSVFRAWTPCLPVALILASTKLPQWPVGAWLRSLEPRWDAEEAALQHLPDHNGREYSDGHAPRSSPRRRGEDHPHEFTIGCAKRHSNRQRLEPQAAHQRADLYLQRTLAVGPASQASDCDGRRVARRQAVGHAASASNERDVQTGSEGCQ